MAGVITHELQVKYGEPLGGMARDHNNVDLGAQTTLYSGRIFHVDSNDMAVEGMSGPGTPLFFAHRGVEHPDVAGLDATVISADLTGGVRGHTGYGRISGVPLRPGLRIQTSEYDSDLSYSVGDGVCCATATGELRKATAVGNSEVLGYVAATPAKVNDLNVLDVRVVRSMPGE